jgi:hypothetical protein
MSLLYWEERIFLISHYGCIFYFQEILFYEDGEPKIDGESGDLKVAIFLYINTTVRNDKLGTIYLWQIYLLSSLTFGQHGMSASEEKATTYIQQWKSHWYSSLNLVSSLTLLPRQKLLIIQIYL